MTDPLPQLIRLPASKSGRRVAENNHAMPSISSFCGGTMNIRRFARLPVVAVSAIFAAALLVAPHLAYSQKQAPLPRSVNFGTHAVGSVFNAVGTGLAKVATDRGPIRVIVQPFSGPTAWIPTINRGGIPDIGIINVTEIWQAYTGKITPRPLPAGAPEMKPPYGPHPNLRLLNLGTKDRKST